MIRGQAGNDQFLLGIAEENVRQLKVGDPIVFKLDEYGLSGPPITIIICYGETEDKLAAKLQEILGPKTIVRDRRRK